MEIKVVRQILEWNENCHSELQKLLNEKKVLMVNVMGSPGGGKTTLIKHLINDLRSEYNIGVIEADIAGKIDAIKIADMGIPVVQLNTDGACHIEAMSIKNILPDFDLDKLDLIFIENIGNLVCPAEFNIGEDIKLAILSVPEGDDKVEKYPLMFTNSEALVINKFDMKPYFDFDDKRVEEKSRQLNPDINLFRISAKNGDGIDELVSYLKNRINNKKND